MRENEYVSWCNLQNSREKSKCLISDVQGNDFIGEKNGGGGNLFWRFYGHFLNICEFIHPSVSLAIYFQKWPGSTRTQHHRYANQLHFQRSRLWRRVSSRNNKWKASLLHYMRCVAGLPIVCDDVVVVVVVNYDDCTITFAAERVFLFFLWSCI